MQTLDTSAILRLEKLMRRLGKPLALGALVGLGAVGCQGTDGSSGPSVQRVGLNAFGNCDDLLDYFQDEALSEVQHWGWIGEDRGDAVAEPAAGGGGQAENDGGPSHSGTNTQEADVDEPDLLKTDGRFIYGVRGRQLLIYRADDLSLVSETLLAGHEGWLLLDGDRLAVLYTAWRNDREVPEGAPARFAHSGKTVIEVWDVADRAAPAQLRRTLVEGQLITARMVAGTARVVVHFDGAQYVDWQPEFGGDRPVAGGTSQDGPSETEAKPDDTPSAGMAQRRDAQEAERMDPEAAWRAAIEETSIADWMPYRLDTAGGEAVAGPLGTCRQFHRPGEASGHGVTAVVSVDLDQPEARFADPAVVTAPGVTYASSGNLYLTTVNHAGWLWGGGVAEDVANSGDVVEAEASGGGATDTAQRRDAQVAAAEREASQVHKLSIGDATAPAAYRASGRVFGHPLNQFSLGEHADHLRIATTENRMQDGPVNHLFVLGEAEGALEQTGAITGIAETERIYAVRLMGERGFMVTFRQVDPLFTMDLSDPANPRMVGELKIPGFSTYLHPYGADHLIGIGQSADEEGRVTGMQLSLFDVSDFADPQQAHVQALGEGWSSALYDHHAFLFWPATDTLAIPVERWDEAEGDHVGLALYSVSAEAGFDETGFVSHSVFGDGWAPNIERSMVIGDAIYAFSRVGVTAHTLEGLAPVAQAAFPEDEGAWDGGGVEPEPAEPLPAEPEADGAEDGGDESD